MLNLKWIKLPKIIRKEKLMIEKLTQIIATLAIIIFVSDFFIDSWRIPINGIFALLALLVGFIGLEQFQKQNKRMAFAYFSFSVFLLFTISFDFYAS